MDQVSMSFGAWLTASTAIAGLFVTLIVGIIKLPIRRKDRNGNCAPPVQSPSLCSEHSGLVVKVDTLHEGQKRIEKSIKDNGKDLWDAIDGQRDDMKELTKTIIKAVKG